MRCAPLWVHMSGERERDPSQHCDRGLLPTPHHPGWCPSSVDGHSHAKQERTLLANDSTRLDSTRLDSTRIIYILVSTRIIYTRTAKRLDSKSARRCADLDSTRLDLHLRYIASAQIPFTTRLDSPRLVGLLFRQHRLNPRWRATRHHTSQHLLGATGQHAFDANRGEAVLIS